MLIKKISILSLVFVCFVLNLDAQARKMYLKYNNDCMTRMEYKAVGNTQGGNLVHYYAQTSAGTQLVLQTRKTAPVRFSKSINQAFMVDCNAVNYNENLMRQCNTGEVDLYVVAQDKDGYFANYIESINLLKDNGNNIRFDSYTYGFQFDKNAINPNNNLSTNSTSNDVMYQGSTSYNCLKNHTFRESSKNTCSSYTDVTFSPKLGVLAMTEFENPQFTNGSNAILNNHQLLYINNLPVDNFVGSYCNGSIPRDPVMEVRAVKPPAPLPTEFEGKGGSSTAPAIVDVPKPAAKPTPPAPKVDPKPKSLPDFSGGISTGSEFGEPTVPVNNYVAECNTYKRAGFHVVRPKESLYSISRMTGISTKDLATWNGISNKAIIPACSELRLTAPTPDMYETLTGIIEADDSNDLREKGGEADKKLNTKPAANGEEPKIHIVKDGETLYAISKKYGFTPEKFMEINGLENDAVSPGMKLFTNNCACELPTDYSPKGVDVPKGYDAEDKIMIRHTMKSGDTLYSIANKYGVSVNKIMKLNNITDPTDLSIGQEVNIK